MKPTDDGTKSNIRSAEKSGKRSSRGSRTKKTESAKRTVQATSPSINGSAKSKTKKKKARLLEFASASGSTLKPSLKSVKAITQKKVDRTAHALRRLHVTPAQLAAAPQITPLLKRAEGGLDQVITAMRFSPDAVTAAFLEKYDSVPQGDREHLSIEAIAVAAKLDISHLLGSVMMALQAQAVNAVKIIAMTSHPKITEARVAYGMLPLGERDRTALDTALGFLPSPKGPTFIGKAVFGSSKKGGGDDDDDGGDDGGDGPDLDKLFPPANAMQEKLTRVRQRMLPPGQ